MTGKVEEGKKSSEEEDDRQAILGPLVSGAERERGRCVGSWAQALPCSVGVLCEFATGQVAAGLAGWRGYGSVGLAAAACLILLSC